MKNIFSILLIFLSVSFAQAQLDRSKRPSAGPAPQINLSKPASFTLPNGLKVFVVENHKLPRVAFSLVLDYDPVFEGEKAGALNMMGELLSRGTTSRVKDQIDQEIDFMGATLNTSATGIYASSLRKHTPQLVELMTDVLLNPKFDKDELEKIRKQTLSSLENDKDDPEAISQRLGNRIIYGEKHPYGESQTEKTVQNVTIEDCQKFYKMFYRPNIAYLAIVGDVTVAYAEELVSKAFANWQKAEVPKGRVPEVVSPAKTSVSLINRSSSVQSIINVAYPLDFTPNDKDVIAASVLNNILGGGASGRLFQNLREKHAFTYGAYSSIDNDEVKGQFGAGASARNIVTDSSVTEILSEMNRIRNEKVGEKELASSLAFLAGSFARGLENPQTIARFAINIDRYGLAPDYYATYLQRLAAITADDVQRVAQRFIQPDKAHIIIVGSKVDVGAKLKKFGEVTVYDTEGNIEKEAPVVAENPQKPLPKVSAKEVMDKYIEAIGGKEKLSKVKDLTVIRNAELGVGAQTLALTMTIYRKAPNLLLNKLDSDMFSQGSLFDGAKGWKSSSMTGKQEVTGDDLKELAIEATMFGEMKYEELGIKMEIVGAEKVNGSDAYIMEITYPTGKKTKEYYDMQSGFKVKETDIAHTPQGDMSITVLYSDYKDIGNGVKLPYSVEQAMGPQKMKMTISSVAVNKKLKAKKVFVLE